GRRYSARLPLVAARRQPGRPRRLVEIGRRRQGGAVGALRSRNRPRRVEKPGPRTSREGARTGTTVDRPIPRTPRAGVARRSRREAQAGGLALDAVFAS